MSNSDPDSPVILPNDLITRVLSFADVKSLIQMKCVSKSWNSIISDPKFAKLHLKRSWRNPHLILYGGDNAVPFPVRHLIKNSRIKLTSDPYYRLMYKDCCYLIGSCNGWLCLLGYSSIPIYRTIWLRFWNPATRKMSPKLGHFWDNFGLYTHFKFGFGCDKSSETYKVVRLFLNEAENRTDVQVLSLGDNVWRPIQSFPVVLVPFQSNPCVSDGVYLNGSLNWVALRSKFSYVGVSGWEKMDVREFVIISLDLGTETHMQLMPPGGYDETSAIEPFVCILMDCLCFSNDYMRTHFVIWKMEEFGVEESWIQLLKISYQNLQSMYCDVYDLRNSQLLPLYLSGDILILANKEEEQAILYNLRDNRAVRTRITNEIQWFCAEVYVESLVSLTF